MSRPPSRRRDLGDDLPLSGARPRPTPPEAPAPAGSARPAAAGRPAGRRTRRFAGATVDRRMLERARAVGRRRKVAPVLGALALALVALGVYALWFSPWLTVREVRVAGAPEPLARDVRRAATPPDGTQLARADLGAARARVLADRRVREATVTRRWPHAIIVTVEPRAAVLAVRNPQGQLEVADRDGVLFEKVGTLPAGVQLVTVKTGAPSQDRLAQVPPVLAALSPDQRKQLGSVAVTGRTDVELVVDKVSVRWGDGSRSEDKAATLAALLKTPEARTKDAVIDVSAPDAPAVLAPHAPPPATPSGT